MLEKQEPEAAFKLAKEEAAHYVTEHVKALKEDSALQDRLYKMIDYAIERFDWYEEQRFKFLQVGLAFITVTAGLSGFIAKINLQMSLISLGLSFSAVVSLLLTGIKLMVIYNELRGITYPYRKIADIRSWFFKYSFDNLPASLSNQDEQSIKEVKEVAKAYKKFVERWTEYANKERGFIEEDLQQVFILQLLQSYRRESLERMHTILFWGIVIFVSLFALAVFTFFLIPPTSAS